MHPSQTIRFEEVHSPSQISRQLLERLAEEIPAETIIDGIRKLLAATFVTKAGVEHPDYRAREAGLKLWMSYQVGLPIQRQVTANVPLPPCEKDAWAKVKQSPAARDALRRMLDAADEDAQRPAA